MTVTCAFKTIEALRKQDNELNHDLHVLIPVFQGVKTVCRIDGFEQSGGM